jgi:hypothetical protein
MRDREARVRRFVAVVALGFAACRRTPLDPPPSGRAGPDAAAARDAQADASDGAGDVVPAGDEADLRVDALDAADPNADAADSDADARDGLADATPEPCAPPPRARAWRATSTLGAPTLSGHKAVWTGKEMLVWGGSMDPSGASGDLATGARYDPAADHWTPISTVGAPRPRVGHSAVWLEATREMMIWGGVDGDDAGGLYAPDADTWRALSLADAPTGRWAPALVSTGREAIVWCGRSGVAPSSGDGAVYDPVADHWRPVSMAGAPPCAIDGPYSWTGRELVVWSGNGVIQLGQDLVGGQPSSEGGLYDPAADQWRPLVGNAPTGRWSASGVFGGGAFVVTGGWTSPDGDIVNDGARWDLATGTWRILHATADVGPIFGPEGGAWVSGGTLACTGAAAFWGGPLWSQGGASVRSGGGKLYFPVEDRWEPISADGAPDARTDHTVLSTGSTIIVWGGTTSSGVTNTGAIYTP